VIAEPNSSALPGMSALDLRNDEPIESNIETAGRKEILVAVGAHE
jgi:hypothetical protein